MCRSSTKYYEWIMCGKKLSENRNYILWIKILRKFFGNISALNKNKVFIILENTLNENHEYIYY